MTINLYYIGEKFYFKSATLMSSVYEVGTRQRYDWGMVKNMLMEGHEVHIRPANEYEMRWANAELATKRRMTT